MSSRIYQESMSPLAGQKINISYACPANAKTGFCHFSGKGERDSPL